MSDRAGEPEADLPAGGAPKGPQGDAWAFDAALGAASILARTVGAVGSSTPVRAVGEATRRLAGPLSREGHDVRSQLGEEATPTAKRIVAQVTPRVTEVVDLNEILAVIDLDQLLAHLDLDAVLERIDLDALLQRIDLDALVGRLDLDAVVGGIDLNALIAKVDVQELVANTEIGGLLAMSSSSIVTTVLDAVRSWVVRVDMVVGRLVNRVLRRDPASLPPGPPRLIGPSSVIDVVATDPSGTSGGEPVNRDLAGQAGPTLQGHYAGAASRLAAYVIDQAVLGLIFVAASAVVEYSIQLFLPEGRTWNSPAWLVAGMYGIWWFAYFAIPWSASGKSFGMLVVGIRVVRRDGSPFGGPGALVRALVLPLGFVTLGLTYIGIVVGREHRALQDCAAGSVVVYDWDARAARLRVMARPDAAAVHPTPDPGGRA